MKNITTLALFLAGAAFIALTSAAAQPAPAPVMAPPAPDFSKVEIKATDLGHGLTELVGGGGNITLAVGSDGIIMVDTEFAPLHDKIKAAIAKISPLPVKFVINTHYHVDHTEGNAAFVKEGAVTVAHANVVQHLLHPANGKPAPKEQIPEQTYNTLGTEVKIPGQTAELVYVPDAHTDGDTMVFWPAANVISTGDVVASGQYPNIDVPGGGGIDGMIAGANFVIAHSDANTKIVPGHGPLTDRTHVIAYAKMLKTARDIIAKAKAKGMTEDQVVQAHLLASLDKTWKDPVADRFPKLIYRSLK